MREVQHKCTKCGMQIMYRTGDHPDIGEYDTEAMACAGKYGEAEHYCRMCNPDWDVDDPDPADWWKS